MSHIVDELIEQGPAAIDTHGLDKIQSHLNDPHIQESIKQYGRAHGIEHALTVGGAYEWDLSKMDYKLRFLMSALTVFLAFVAAGKFFNRNRPKPIANYINSFRVDSKGFDSTITHYRYNSTDDMFRDEAFLRHLRELDSEKPIESIDKNDFFRQNKIREYYPNPKSKVMLCPLRDGADIEYHDACTKEFYDKKAKNSDTYYESLDEKSPTYANTAKAVYNIQYGIFKYILMRLNEKRLNISGRDQPLLLTINMKDLKCFAKITVDFREDQGQTMCVLNLYIYEAAPENKSALCEFVFAIKNFVKRLAMVYVENDKPLGVKKETGMKNDEIRSMIAKLGMEENFDEYLNDLDDSPRVLSREEVRPHKDPQPSPSYEEGIDYKHGNRFSPGGRIAEVDGGNDYSPHTMRKVKYGGDFPFFTDMSLVGHALLIISVIVLIWVMFKHLVEIVSDWAEKRKSPEVSSEDVQPIHPLVIYPPNW